MTSLPRRTARSGTRASAAACSESSIRRREAKSGEVKVFKDPDGRGPYGIASTPSGDVWYVSLAGSHLARIEDADGRITVVEPPDPNAGLRRVWSDSKGDLWITGWNNGKLYRYRPAQRSWKSWQLPGAAPKAYAVYVDEQDKIWVSDFGANATLRFDPATERFESLSGSGPEAAVRQIPGRKGEVYLPESGLDRVMLVRFR
jgi:virginiamycin B lyase